MPSVRSGPCSPPRPGSCYRRERPRTPIERALVRHFDRSLDELWAVAAPSSMIDVGCGEGVLTEHWARRLEDGRVVGVDLVPDLLTAEWKSRARANLEFRGGDASSLQFADAEFDLAAATEVLEHVDDPGRVLGELARIARRYLLVSVPREPLWRALNLARGAYIGSLGNTPGHVNHWTRNGFVELIGSYGFVRAVRSPPPWTVALVRKREP
jgi:2-polyprenyl-3-methyl-5-hydroxy-6-metoxy-1,4-benzoquinol methylase